MVSATLNFWSTSRKENLESQQKHALRDNLCVDFCLGSNDNFHPEYKRKMVIRRRISILDIVCFNSGLFFHPVQCTACKICQDGSIDKLVLPRAFVTLSL